MPPALIEFATTTTLEIGGEGMHDRRRSLRVFLFVILLVVPLAAASPGEDVAHPAGRNVADMQFVGVPGLPSCSQASVQSGDPSKGPSILLARLETGCSFPWHWHTPTENLMLVSGEGRVETKDDGKALALRAGGFAQMPSRHIHQFSCAMECTLYVVADGAFDMHYVNAEGKEISPDEAMKRVGETATKSPE